jgi:hypothetical protein
MSTEVKENSPNRDSTTTGVKLGAISQSLHCQERQVLAEIGANISQEMEILNYNQLDKEKRQQNELNEKITPVKDENEKEESIKLQSACELARMDSKDEKQSEQEKNLENKMEIAQQAQSLAKQTSQHGQKPKGDTPLVCKRKILIIVRNLS